MFILVLLMLSQKLRYVNKETQKFTELYLFLHQFITLARQYEQIVNNDAIPLTLSIKKLYTYFSTRLCRVLKLLNYYYNGDV